MKSTLPFLAFLATSLHGVSAFGLLKTVTKPFGGKELKG
jgi:hypothetical protein